MILILNIVCILSIILIPLSFKQYSDMDYVEHLEQMGVFVDENGKEI